jgi:hypothetical protein
MALIDMLLGEKTMSTTFSLPLNRTPNRSQRANEIGADAVEEERVEEGKTSGGRTRRSLKFGREMPAALACVGGVVYVGTGRCECM